MTQPEPEHWSTERMILEGHAEYVTPEDLQELEDDLLYDIAKICDVEVFAPDECIPCLAYTMHLERRKAELERLEAMNPYEELPDDEDEGNPLLDALMNEEPGFIPVEVKRRPPVEVLQFQVSLLSQTLEEIVDGPPIPPKDVSLAELALLVLAADKWVKITEVQGSEMSPNQQTVLDSTKSLVARLRP